MNSSLDTNVLLRYILNDVPEQTRKAVKLLGDESQIFHVSDVVIAEVIFNLQIAELSRKDIAEVLMKVLSLPNMVANELVIDKVLPYFVEHPALSFVDCLSAFEAEAQGAEPLWTFDKKLANQHPNAKRL